LTAEQSATTECPYCKEEVKADAVLCKHCGSRLSAQAPEHGGVCPYCKESIHPEARRCKHCGSDLEAKEKQGGDCCCGCGSGTGRSLFGAEQQMFRNQLAGGTCHDRCIFACGSSSPGCEYLCNWICEFAPVIRPAIFR
jgi:hypothetical protein